MTVPTSPSRRRSSALRRLHAAPRALLGGALLTSAIVAGPAGCNAGSSPAPGDQPEIVAAASEGLVSAGTCVTLQRAGASGAVFDAQIANKSPYTANYGASGTMNTGLSGSPATERRSLLQFDLSSIPSNAWIGSATVTLYASASAPATVNVHQVLSPWTEGQVSWQSASNTFAPSPVTSFGSGPAQNLAGGVMSVTPMPVTFDITSLAQSWVSGSAANHGVLLEQAPTGEATLFRASEWFPVSQRPALQVCYQIATCNDGAKNGGETDVDCGGSCAPCGAGLACASAADCASGVCVGGACQAPSCSDGVKNGNEASVDCGGSCAPCAVGAGCQTGADCTSGVCAGGACQAPSCSDGVKNGNETGVDIGGACARPETCNGIDDDGNGLVDDGLGNLTCGVGACQRTVAACVGGQAQTCTPGTPVAEVCDGLVDDDCDGIVDNGCACINGQTQTCYGGAPGTLGVGLCHAGTQTCVGGQWGACAGQVLPAAETCDGLDNDCNGQVDENLGQTSCGVGACVRTVANCVGGQPQQCAPGSPSAEVCDGIDNDCDGQVDEGNPGGGAACNTGLQGVCATGAMTCTAGQLSCQQTVFASTEICADGVDNNCNGQVDEATAGCVTPTSTIASWNLYHQFTTIGGAGSPDVPYTVTGTVTLNNTADGYVYALGSYYNAQNGNLYQDGIVVSGGKLQFQTQYYVWVSVYPFTANNVIANITPGQQFHLAVEVFSTTGLRVYINGQLIKTITTAAYHPGTTYPALGTSVGLGTPNEVFYGVQGTVQNFKYYKNAALFGGAAFDYTKY